MDPEQMTFEMSTMQSTNITGAKALHWIFELTVISICEVSFFNMYILISVKVRLSSCYALDESLRMLCMQLHVALDCSYGSPPIIISELNRV